MTAAAGKRHGRHLFALLSWSAAVVSLGCAGHQSALNPSSPQAQSIASLWWFFVITTGVVYVLTMVFMLVPAVRSWRSRRSEAGATTMPVTMPPDAASERRRTAVVWGATFVTVIILFVLLVADFVTGRSLHRHPEAEPVKIQLTARQWWWEVRYESATPSATVTTANEIHIPVGRPVVLDLRAADVIHSFWIPSLHGKKDMIPDHPTTTWLRADKPGEYWGQCAEFCGYQHAKMRLLVVAEPPAQFEAWRAAQLAQAGEPASPEQRRGRELFVGGTCLLCHTIAGTDARGRIGPDLTHLAGRQRIASNWLANRPDELARWILDPQKIKPGVRMPQHDLPESDLRALVQYLESLK